MIVSLGLHLVMRLYQVCRSLDQGHFDYSFQLFQLSEEPTYIKICIQIRLSGGGYKIENFGVNYILYGVA